jgi:hypothetical protein
MARYIMTVRSNPVAGREAEYNEWYDRHHVPDLLMTPTLIAAQRYRLAPVRMPVYPGYVKPRHSYMVVYEIDTESLEKTRDLLWSAENVARIRPSAAFDSSSVDCQFFAPMGPRAIQQR